MKNLTIALGQENLELAEEYKTIVERKKEAHFAVEKKKYIHAYAGTAGPTGYIKARTKSQTFSISTRKNLLSLNRSSPRSHRGRLKKCLARAHKRKASREKWRSHLKRRILI